MIHNYDKVQTEIEIWTQLNHPYIAKLYEMIDDDNHDYLYLILEYANMGQIATWNPKLGHYERSEAIYNFVTEHLKLHNGLEECERPQTTKLANDVDRVKKVDTVGQQAKTPGSLPPLELVAQYLFR
jgi:Protein kinase domain